MGRHAYLIMVHDRPEQFRKLLHLLDDERNDIFVHIDGKAGFKPSAFEGACTKSGLTFIQSRNIHWGGFSQMWTEVRLLQASVPGRYSRYHLLSGRDLPLHSQDYIHDFMDRHPDSEFISIWPDTEESGIRFHYYALFPEGNRFFLTHFFNGLTKSILKALGIRMNRDITPKYGTNWFSITDECARLVAGRADWIRRIFAHVSNGDEMMLQTTVWNSGLKERIDGRDLRLVDWSAGGRHPHTFTIADWERLDNAEELFARKFDENADNAVIEKLYSKLNG